MSSSLGAEGERDKGSRARAEPRRAFQAVRGLRGTLVPARTRAESKAAAREGVSGAAKLPSRSANERASPRTRGESSSGGGQPDRSLTVRWARPPVQGRRCRGRLARPHRISPPSRGSGDAAAAALAAGSPHVSPLPRNSGRGDVTLPWQQPPRWFPASQAAAAAVPETCSQAHARLD